MKERASGFSLVEVTLALALFSFALVAVVGLLPVGLNTTRQTQSQNRASLILSSFFATWEIGAVGANNTLDPFPGISKDSDQLQKVYLDEQGRSLSNTNLATFVLEVRSRPGDPGPLHARVGWPAARPINFVEGVVYSKKGL